MANSLQDLINEACYSESSCNYVDEPGNLPDIPAYNNMIQDARQYTTPSLYNAVDMADSVQSLMDTGQWLQTHPITATPGMSIGISPQADDHMRCMPYEQQLYYLTCPDWQTPQRRPERDRLQYIMQVQHQLFSHAYPRSLASVVPHGFVDAIESRPCAPTAYHDVPIYRVPETTITTAIQIASFVDRFESRSTHDQALFDLYGRVIEVGDRNVTTLIRLELQRRHWIWLANEVHLENYKLLSRRCKDLILLLRKEDATVAARAARYLTEKLSKYPSHGQNLSQTSIFDLTVLWWRLHTDAFLHPQPLAPPVRGSGYRFHVVTFLKWRGGEPSVFKPLEVPRSNFSCFQLKSLLTLVTTSIQSKQLGFRDGFQNGEWYYTEDVVSDWAVWKELGIEKDWTDVKRSLRKGASVTVIHSWQLAIRRNLLKMDAAHLGVLRSNAGPLVSLPAGYSPNIAASYAASWTITDLTRDVDLYRDPGLIKKRRSHAKDAVKALVRKDRRKRKKQLRKAAKWAEKKCRSEVVGEGGL